MSIELKAKTMLNWYKDAQQKTGESFRIALEQQLVPLEEAQKLENEVMNLKILNKKLQGKLDTEPDALMSQLTIMTNHATEAESKIAEANKILDEISEGWRDHVLIKKIVTANDLQRLREVLNANQTKIETQNNSPVN